MEAKFSNEEILKLPKWAQKRINALQFDIEYYENKMQSMLGEHETNTFVKLGTKDQPLPLDSRIKFKLEDGNIDCFLDNDHLEISATYYEKDFVILPKISNAIILKFA